MLDRLLSDNWKTLINHRYQLSQLLTSLLDEVQLEQLAVETFFSPSFLLASSSAAATSIPSYEWDFLLITDFSQIWLKLTQTSSSFLPIYLSGFKKTKNKKYVSFPPALSLSTNVLSDL